VASRVDDLTSFVRSVEHAGFECVSTKDVRGFFFVLRFKKMEGGGQSKNGPVLKPARYKRR
jgi:hypothetical protein